MGRECFLKVSTWYELTVGFILLKMNSKSKDSHLSWKSFKDESGVVFAAYGVPVRQSWRFSGNLPFADANGDGIPDWMQQLPVSGLERAPWQRQSGVGLPKLRVRSRV